MPLSEEVEAELAKRADTRRVYQDDVGCLEEREPDSSILKSSNPEN